MKTNQMQKNIPSDWQQVKLGDISNVIMGQSPLSSAYNEIKQGLPLIQGNNDIKSKKTVGNIWTTQITKTAEKGQLILTVRAPVGAVGIAHDKVCIGRGVCAIETKYKNFIWYFLNYFESKWNTLEQGSTFSAVNSSDIKKVKLPLPPLPEQNRIVSVLETWDNAIEKLSKKIEVKKQIKKGLMQDLLTGKKRLDGFNDKWQVKSLKDLTSISKGKQLNIEHMYGGDYPVINGGIIESGFTDQKNTNKNTITISEGGNSCGFVNYITKDFWLGGHCYRIDPLESIDQMFLYFLLKLNELKIMSLRVGSGLPNIQLKALNSIKLSIPKSKEEQSAIAQILTTADIEIKRLENKLKILKEQKRYLLNNLITGTIRTSETLSAKLTK